VPDDRPQDTPPAVSLPTIQRSWIGHYGPDHDRAGQLIERRATCQCGSEFAQMQLSASWLSTMERRNPQIVQAFAQQTPGFWVPAHCPPCERKDLTLRAQIDEARSRSAGTASATLPDTRRTGS
jgi:hypothetical protein